MIKPRSWLPDDAFTDSAIESCLKGSIANWSSSWFAHVDATIAEISAGVEQAWPNGLAVRGICARAGLSARGKRSLLEAILNLDLANVELGDGDRRVLDALAARAIDDLVAGLDRAFEAEVDQVDDVQVSLRLVVGANDLLTLTIPQYVLVPRLKALATKTKGSLPVRSRESAVAATPVVVRGVLGFAEIGLHELGELNPGDVLILDRALQEPIELRLAETNQQIAMGRLARSGQQISIQL